MTNFFSDTTLALSAGRAFARQLDRFGRDGVRNGGVWHVDYDFATLNGFV